MSTSSSSHPSSSHSSSIGNPTSGRGLYLRRLAQTRFQINVIDGFRFRVEAHDASQMTTFIFRYLRRPLNPDTQTTADEFDGICSPPDIEEFGESAPIPGMSPPYLRLDYVDLVFRSQAEALEAWTVIVQDVTVLVNTLNAMDVLAQTDDLTIGSPAPLS